MKPSLRWLLVLPFLWSPMCTTLDVTAGAYYQQPDGSQIGAYVKLDETFAKQKK